MSDSPIYNFSQASPEAKPGFESFKGKEDSRYYFHYNDAKGQPILFSEGFPSAKTRAAVLSALKHHISLARSYSEIKEDEQYFFIIRATNNVEIARSRPFLEAEERDVIMKKLIKEQSALKTTKSSTKKTPADKEEPKPTSPIPEKAIKNKPGARFKFNLTFRKVDDDKPFQGVIEYPIVKKKATFKGLDLERIGTFVAGYLPDEAQLLLPGAGKEKALLEQLEELQQKEKQAQENIVKLTSKTEQLQKLQQKEKQAQEKIAELESQTEQLKNQLIGAAENQMTIKATLQKAKENTKELQEELANTQEAYQKIQTQLKQAKDKENTLKKQLASTKTQQANAMEQAKKELAQAKEKEQTLQQQLKEAQKKPAPAPVVQKIVLPPKKEVPKAPIVVPAAPKAKPAVQVSTPPGTPLPNPAGLQILYDGSIVQNQVIDKGALFQLQMQSSSSNTPTPMLFEALIYAKSMERGQKTLIGNFTGKVQTNGNITIPVRVPSLSSGLYRITLSVQLKDPAHTTNDIPLEGSTLLQLN